MSAAKRLESARKISTLKTPVTPSTLRTSQTTLVGGSGSYKLNETAYVTGTEKFGIVRYCGPVHFSTGEWVGLELATPIGKNDGSVQGQRYFDCRPMYGLFVRSSICTRIRPSHIFAPTVPTPIPRGISSATVLAVPKASQIITMGTEEINPEVESITGPPTMSSISSVGTGITPAISPRGLNADLMMSTDTMDAQTPPSALQRPPSRGRGRFSLGGEDVDDFGLPLRQVPSRRASETRSTPSSAIKPRIMDSRFASGLVQARLAARPNTPTMNRSRSIGNESMLDRLDSALVLPGKAKPKGNNRSTTPTTIRQFSYVANVDPSNMGLSNNSNDSSNARPITPSSEMDDLIANEYSRQENDIRRKQDDEDGDSVMDNDSPIKRNDQQDDNNSVNINTSNNRNSYERRYARNYDNHERNNSNNNNNGRMNSPGEKDRSHSNHKEGLDGDYIQDIVEKILKNSQLSSFIEAVASRSSSKFETSVNGKISSCESRISTLQESLGTIESHIQQLLEGVSTVRADSNNMSENIRQLVSSASNSANGTVQSEETDALRTQLKAREEEIEKLQLSMQSILNLVKIARDTSDQQKLKYEAEISRLQSQEQHHQQQPHTSSM